MFWNFSIFPPNLDRSNNHYVEFLIVIVIAWRETRERNNVREQCDVTWAEQDGKSKDGDL